MSASVLNTKAELKYHHSHEMLNDNHGHVNTNNNNGESVDRRRKGFSSSSSSLSSLSSSLIVLLGMQLVFVSSSNYQVSAFFTATSSLSLSIQRMTTKYDSTRTSTISGSSSNSNTMLNGHRLRFGISQGGPFQFNINIINMNTPVPSKTKLYATSEGEGNVDNSFEINIDDEIDMTNNNGNNGQFENDNDKPASASSSSSTKTPNKEKLESKELNLGNWEYLHGNYLLRPPPTSPYTTEPRALLHFLGGAIVGAAPDITYRYILEKLAAQGFLIVSTPFTLSFDYITTCDTIITKFERVAPSLAQQYGPIPVVGVGHSCGSLLHLLITTLFPDTPRAGNVLMSYNNMNVKDAVPFFEEVVTPLFVSLSQNGTVMGGGSDDVYPSSSTEVLNLSLDLGRSLIQGTIPSDEAITNIIQKTTPRPFSSIVPKDITIPTQIRQSIETNLLDPINKAKSDAGITPLLEQSIDILEQIPSLIEEVANGARDFNPKPESVRAAARRAYRARKTLLVQYDNDPIDESEEIESLLKEAETVMKNKRPMVDFDVRRVVLSGSHVTPCVAPPLDLATQVENLVGEGTAKDKLLYRGADETVDEIVGWLEEGNL